MPIEDLPPINNDHVLDPARGLIYLSANDGHIYVAPIAGGTPRESRMIRAAITSSTVSVRTVRRSLSSSCRVGIFGTRAARARRVGGRRDPLPEAGSSHLDGPEYSPDGAWLYLNTEEYASVPAMRSWPGFPPAAAPWNAGGVGHGRLVPASVAGRRDRELHQLPDRVRSGIRPT